MEVNIGEIIVEEELEIGGLELDVIKVGGGTGGAKEVYIGSNEPTDEDIVVWIDTSEEADIIPTKTSELENDSGFIENIGTFNEWDELNSYNFENNSIFMFNMAGGFSIFAGTYIGHFNGYKSGETYAYKYINCININNIQSLQLDMLNKNIVVRQIPINDSNDYFKSDGLDSILQEIGSQLNGVEDLLGGI